MNSIHHSTHMILKDKVAIVTGSGRGIGRAIAIKLAKAGAKVVVTSRHTEECDEVCEVIDSAKGESLCIKCDVSKKEEVDHLIQKTIEAYGDIDILVNNAGILRQKPLTDMTEEDWDSTMDINLKGAFLLAQAVAPFMIKKKAGKILSIASVAGEVGFTNISAYCASKGGLINLTRELALELAPFNINVNAIAPGVIETKMTESMLENEASRTGLLSQVPLGRVGQADEIAKAAKFLVSNDSNYITGQTLAVDGGWLAK